MYMSIFFAGNARSRTPLKKLKLGMLIFVRPVVEPQGSYSIKGAYAICILKNIKA